MKINLRNNRFLFFGTLLFFTLGFVNIHFAALGFICMILPMVLLVRDKRKTWCQSYCPRANLFTKCGRITSGCSYKTPKLFIKGPMNSIMLAYFGISLFVIIISTIMVAKGSVEPMKYLRFLMIIPLYGEMPQLFVFTGFPVWFTHMAYRFYSMMMTTTILGLILAIVYKPRTWCIICPIATISEMYLKGRKVKNEKPA